MLGGTSTEFVQSTLSCLKGRCRREDGGDSDFVAAKTTRLHQGATLIAEHHSATLDEGAC